MENDGSETVEQLELELMQLLETDRYNPEILPTLCKGLNSQIEHNWFSTEINLGIIKLIQFYPETQDWNYKEIIQQVLLKVLLNLPRPELQLTLLMIPEPYQSDFYVQEIAELGTLLETARFKEFWRKEAQIAEYESLVPGFSEQVRNFILEDLGLTFSTIERTMLCEYLNVEDYVLESVFDNEALTKVEGFVVLGQTEQNQPKPKEVEKLSHLKLSQITPLISQLLR